MRLKQRILPVLALLIAAVGAARAQTTRNVGPGQTYTTIQSAINAATPGDTVLVAPGTYYENINFLGKAITVTSSGGAAATIIDGGGKLGSATVAFVTGETRSSVISNFTIRGGGADLYTAAIEVSGGVFAYQSAPTVLNNLITANQCNGVVSDEAAALIQGNTLENTAINTSGDCILGNAGSAVLEYGYSLNFGSGVIPTILGNTIENNSFGITGGVYLWSGNHTVIQGNTFRNNVGEEAGAIASANTNDVAILQNLFYANSGAGAGAIYLAPPDYSVGQFIGILAGNTIAENTVTGLNTSGGDVPPSQIYMSGNLAQYAFVNNIIVGNAAGTTAVNCDVGYSSLALTPLVFDHNDIAPGLGSSVTGSCTNPTGSYGNISSDPQFVNAAADNFQLAAGSPAIDAGNNSAPMMPSLDFAGSPRIQDATGLGYPVVDMGAFEYSGRLDAAPTILTLTPSVYYNPVYPFGQPTTETFTVALSSSAGTPAGPVTILQDGVTFATVNVDSTGVATLPNLTLQPGLHAYTAIYTGSGLFPAAVSVKFYLLVPPYSTTLTLASSANPSILASSVTFTVNATSTDIHSIPSPITLTDTSTNTVLATLTPNSSGVATYSTSSLSLGYHNLTASYAGDSTHGTATAALTQQVISGYGTTTILTSSLNPSTYGQPVTFTAQITATSGTPTGSVTFTDYGVTLGTSTVNNSGIATFTTSTLAASDLGSATQHVILATFNPTGSYMGSTASLTQTVASAALAIPVGSTSPVQTSTLTFATSATLSSLSVLTQGSSSLDFNLASGGTCSIGTLYAAGQNCTVNFTFAPIDPGQRFGGIAAYAGTSLIASTYIAGLGTGPLAVFEPENETLFAKGIGQPGGIAFDAKGDTFIVDQQLSDVVEITPTSSTTYNQATVVSGLRNPIGIAVDGLGDLFIADSANQRVLKETPSGSGYTQGVIYTSSSGAVPAVAVDATGDVFVADQGSNSIVELTPSVSGYTTSTIYTVASPLVPFAIAIDSAGDVFVDEINPSSSTTLPASTILELTPFGAGYSVGFVDGNLTDIRAMTVDAAGDVYLAQGNNGGAMEEVPTSSGYNRDPLIGAASAITGVALDGHGNVYLAQASATYAVRELDLATPSLVPFATTQIGSTSSDSPRSIAILNVGNAPLTFTLPASSTNPTLTSGFTLTNGSSCLQLTASSLAFSVAPATYCSYHVSFTPTVPGNITGQLTLSDNTLNIATAQQVFPLQGTATAIATTSTLTASPNPSSLGSAVTITANISPATLSGYIAGGSVTFYDNGNSLGSATLSNGSASLTTSTLPFGSSSLTCTYSGDTDFAPSSCAALPASVLPVVLTAQTITFASTSTAYAQTSIALNATASSNLPITYTLLSGPAILNGSTLTFTAPGTVVVEADQPGNAAFNPAPPVQQTLTVTALTEPVSSNSGPVSTLVTFTSAGTLNNIAALTQGAANLDFNLAAGGTCKTGLSYTAGQTCTINFTFDPTRPGARYGGLTLTDASGNLLASSHIFGIGTGPQLLFTPATQTTVASGFTKPAGLAFDGNGNLFVSEAFSGTIKELSAASGFTTTTLTIGGFTNPAGLAFDGNGNLFVADYYGNAVDEVLASSNYTTTLSLGSGFNQPSAVALDANGNLFVADSTHNAVKELPAAAGYSTVVILPGSYSNPRGVALDANGNLFVADIDTLTELTSASGYTTAAKLPSAVDFASSLAIDDRANLYISDENNGNITQILADGGYSTVNILLSSLLSDGVTLDANGNIFATNYSHRTLIELDRSDAPTLTFANTPVGTTSSDSPQAVTFTNNGNAPLVFNGVTPFVTHGFTADLSSTCPLLNEAFETSSLAAGNSCTYAVSFTPVLAGPLYGELQANDNNLNVPSSQVIPLNGTAAADPTTATLTVTPNSATQGAAVTLTATVSTTAANPVQPTGYITFFVNGVSYGEFAVTGNTASYIGTTFPVGTDTITCAYGGDTLYSPSTCNPVTLTIIAKVATTTTAAVTPEPSLYGQPTTFSTHVAAASGNAIPTGSVVFTFCHGATTTVTLDASGNGSITTPTGSEISESAGSCPFTAQYSGDANFATSTSAPVAYIVLPAPSTTSLTVQPSPGYIGQQITLTATVSGVPSTTLGPGGQIIPPGAQTPTGPVNFYSNGTLIGSATITNGIATLVTTTLPAGTDTLQAIYPGDPNLTGSNSSTLAEVILLPDFTLTTSTPTLTLVTGHRGSITLTLTSLSGWTGPITFACPNLPPFATCTPPTVFLAPNGTLTTTLILDTSGSPRFYGANRPPTTARTSAELFTLASLLPLSLLVLPRSRRKHLRTRLLQSTLTLALLTLATTALTSCANTYPDFTPPGTYTIPLTATGTDANLTTPTTHTLNVTLTVTE